MTSVSLPVVASAPPLLQHAEVAYDELLRLGSLARALDPSLPETLRYFRRTEADVADRTVSPGRVFFTTDHRPSLENGLQDAQPIGLFEALEHSLPASLVGLLRERLENATARPSPSGIVVQAFEAAHAAGRVPLEARPTHDPHYVIEASPDLKPAPLAFRDDAFLTDVAAAHLKRLRHPGENGEDRAYDFISTVNSVRQALSGDASRFPASRVSDVIKQIRSLDGLPGEAPFEERAQQGWIAYSLLAGGKGWTVPLLKQAGKVVKPYTAYQGVSPALAAVARNDATALGALLEAGVSANAFLSELPPIFGRDQAKVEESVGSRPTLALVGSALGCTEAVARLIQQGAMVDLPNGQGTTPLGLAAQSNNEALARVLLNAGADPLKADNDGVSPRDLAQGTALLDVLDAPAFANGPVVQKLRR